MLGYDGSWYGSHYTLYLDEVLVTELPEAPAITKQNLDSVYRSDVHEFIGEVVTRVTW